MRMKKLLLTLLLPLLCSLVFLTPSEADEWLTFNGYVNKIELSGMQSFRTTLSTNPLDGNKIGYIQIPGNYIGTLTYLRIVQIAYANHLPVQFNGLASNYFSDYYSIFGISDAGIKNPQISWDDLNNKFKNITEKSTPHFLTTGYIQGVTFSDSEHEDWGEIKIFISDDQAGKINSRYLLMLSNSNSRTYYLTELMLLAASLINTNNKMQFNGDLTDYYNSKIYGFEILKEYSANILLTSSPQSVKLGNNVTVKVHIENTGNIIWQKNGTNQFRCRPHLYDENGKLLIGNFIVNGSSLPKDVAPGESVDISLSFNTTKTGKYMLGVDMVQENVKWFGNEVKITFEVSP